MTNTLKSIKFNLPTSTPLNRKPPHCLLSVKVYNPDDEQIGTLVIDYYTPKSDKSGWWLALRKPGYQKGVHPQRLVYIKEGLETPNIHQVNRILIDCNKIINIKF